MLQILCTLLYTRQYTEERTTAWRHTIISITIIAIIITTITIVIAVTAITTIVAIVITNTIIVTTTTIPLPILVSPPPVHHQYICASPRPPSLIDVQVFYARFLILLNSSVRGSYHACHLVLPTLDGLLWLGHALCAPVLYLPLCYVCLFPHPHPHPRPQTLLCTPRMTLRTSSPQAISRCTPTALASTRCWKCRTRWGYSGVHCAGAVDCRCHSDCGFGFGCEHECECVIVTVTMTEVCSLLLEPRIILRF